MTPRAASTLISPREPARLASAMPAETILVAPLSCVEATIEDARVGHLVTLINGETMVNTPASIQPGRHLRLAMNDICDPQPGLVVPCENHVTDLVQFALDWDRQAPLLIHCWAGISRSTAAAFISLCALNPDTAELRLAQALREASPTAYPNRRLVALADQTLSRQGRMVAAVEEIGRGELAEEAQVFSLPALHAA